MIRTAEDENFYLFHFIIHFKKHLKFSRFIIKTDSRNWNYRVLFSFINSVINILILRIRYGGQWTPILGGVGVVLFPSRWLIIDCIAAIRSECDQCFIDYNEMKVLWNQMILFDMQTAKGEESVMIEFLHFNATEWIHYIFNSKWMNFICFQ